MTDWPTSWAHMTLTQAGIEPTQYGEDVMNAWQASTPLDAWTNNPIGVPANAAGILNVPGSPYGIFAHFADFRVWFAKWIRTPPADQISFHLNGGNNYAAAWRAINGLNWPGGKTETDYPSALLDLTEQSYRESIDATPADQRKSSGPVLPLTDTHGMSVSLAQARAVRLQALNDTGQAIRNLGKRLI